MTNPTDFAIETTSLGRRFGRQWVVKNLSMQIPKGSVYGFLGLNGAGKSTTMRMMMGLLTPHAGKSSVLGFDPQKNDQTIKKRVGYVGERPHFYDWMTVREIMAFVAHYRKEHWDDLRAEQLVGVFSLPKDKQLKTLSKGQLAKVSLLLSMAFNPEVLILDEPTLGLDPVVRREFVKTLLAEYMEEGNTVLISSHLVDEISGLVDHIGILQEGVLVRQEPVDEFRAKVRQVRLNFENTAPLDIHLPGQISQKISGREALITVDGFDEKAIYQAVDIFGPSCQYNTEELSLEDAFIEVTTGGGGENQ